MRVAERTRRPFHEPSAVSARSRGACAARACCEAPPSSARFDFGHVSVFPPVQPRLEITQPGDAYEQEADRVADEVMRMSRPGRLLARMTPATASAGTVSRKCRACAEEDEARAAGALVPDEDEDEMGGGLVVDRDMPLPDGSSTMEEEEEILPESAPVAGVQRQPAGGAAGGAMRPAGPADLVPGLGRALDPALRAVFEPRFGFSFDRVRVHTDTRSAAAARSLGALAYTIGHDIVFGAGQYALDSAVGQRLLAHELAHVVQQDDSLPPLASARLAGGPTVVRPGTVGRAVVQRWTTGGTAPTNTNTIVCDGSGGVRVQVGAPGNADQAACLTDCIRRHEESHRSDALASNSAICDGKANQIQVTFSSVDEQKASEIRASDAEIACLNGKLGSASDTCKPIIRARITQITAYRDSFR